MLLQIKTQGFPKVISDLGIASPLSGPFWGFETTVIPTYSVGGSDVPAQAGVPFTGFASVGEVATPGAQATLANTVIGHMQVGYWAIRASWAFVNASAGSSWLQLVRRDQNTFAALETEYLVAIGGTTVGDGRIGSGFRDFVLHMPVFGDQWTLTNSNALATAGSVVVGSLRFRYLGNVLFPT